MNSFEDEKVKEIQMKSLAFTFALVVIFMALLAYGTYQLFQIAGFNNTMATYAFIFTSAFLIYLAKDINS